MVLGCIYPGHTVAVLFNPDPSVALNYLPAVWGRQAPGVVVRHVDSYTGREGGVGLPRVQDSCWTWHSAGTALRNAAYQAHELHLPRLVPNLHFPARSCAALSRI